jgi:hypothetical protein
MDQAVIATAVSTTFAAVSADVLMIRQHNQDKGGKIKSTNFHCNTKKEAKEKTTRMCNVNKSQRGLENHDHGLHFNPVRKDDNDSKDH